MHRIVSGFGAFPSQPYGITSYRSFSETHHGDSECGGEHDLGEELLVEQPLGDSSETDLSEDEPASPDLAEASAALVPVEDGTHPPSTSLHMVGLHSTKCVRTFVRRVHAHSVSTT